LTEKRAVYVRAASGLVREWSQADAAIYNFMVMGMLTTVMPLMLLIAPAFFSGANIPLAYLLGVLGVIPFLLVLSMLASAMPRSGGDYVIVSRIIHPAVGFMSTTGSCTIYYCCWMAWNGWLLAEGLSFTGTVLGKVLGSPLLSGFGAWAGTTGGIVAITLLSIFIPALLISFGMKVYARVDYVLFAGLVTGSAILLGLLIIGTQSDFVQAFNSFMLPYLGANAYNNVIEVAKQAGYTLNTNFSWWHTFVFMGWAIGAHIIWAWFSTPHVGEIKKARSLWQTFGSFALPMIGACTFMVAIIVSYFDTVGLEFAGAIGYLWVTGHPLASSLPFSPYYIFLPTLIFGVIPIVVALVGFAYVCQLVYFNATNILNPVKYLFAQAFDGILPRKVAYVYKRFHTPLVAIGIMVLGGIIWMAWSWYFPEVWDYVASVAAANLIQYCIILVAGILFPYRLKEVYKASTCSKYTIGKIPLITIISIVGLAPLMFSIYTYLVVPELGAAVPQSWATITIVFLACFIFYFVSKWFRKRQGIDLELAFKEIPPE